MKLEDLKNSAKPVGELKNTEVQTALKGCDVIYGIDVKSETVVQFGKKTTENDKGVRSAKSMAFTYDKDKGEYELLRAAATTAFGEHVVMKED